jgi:hypothetical protein
MPPVTQALQIVPTNNKQNETINTVDVSFPRELETEVVFNSNGFERIANPHGYHLSISGNELNPAH